MKRNRWMGRSGGGAGLFARSDTARKALE